MSNKNTTIWAILFEELNNTGGLLYKEKMVLNNRIDVAIIEKLDKKARNTQRILITLFCVCLIVIIVGLVNLYLEGVKTFILFSLLGGMGFGFVIFSNQYNLQMRRLILKLLKYLKNE